MASATVSEPLLPPVAKMLSIEITNVTAKLVHITYDMQVQSFGIAYSEDLVNWTIVGESYWTNSVAVNPFLQPGLTEHSVWMTDDAWMVSHTPGVGTNAWKLHLFDLIVPADKPHRFYMVYPLGEVTGVP